MVSDLRVGASALRYRNAFVTVKRDLTADTNDDQNSDLPVVGTPNSKLEMTLIKLLLHRNKEL